MRRKRIVVIGGGTGTFTVLSGLKRYPVDLTAIVSMADDGGSTGILREEFGILPPGDVRRALVALSQHPDKLLADLFNYRFKEGGVNGHSFGNLMLIALERITGSFEGAVATAGRLLAACGDVVPVTLSNVRLHAELEDGNVIVGEGNIDVPRHNGALAIKRVWLAPVARANPRAIAALKNADVIVVGPGDMYTSIIPNFLVPGMRKAFLESKAQRVYILNLMTKYGETHGFLATDFLRVLEEYTAPGAFHVVLANSEVLAGARIRRYAAEHAVPVHHADLPAQKTAQGTAIVRRALLRAGELVRHDSAKLARAIVRVARVEAPARKNARYTIE